LIGLTFGLAFMVPLLRWLDVLGPDAWLALAALCAAFYALFGWAAALTARLPASVAVAATCWVGMEWMRANVPFGGFPWGRIAFATADSEVVALTRWVGVPATSGLVVLAAAGTAWGVVHGDAVAPACSRAGGPGKPGRPVRGGCEPAGRTGYSRVHTDGGDRAGRRARHGSGEPGRAQRGHRQPRQRDPRLCGADRRRGAERPDVVFWPENSTDIDPFRTPAIYATIDDAVRAVSVPTLVGVIVDGPEEGQAQNVGLVWDPETGPAPQRYVKRHLVPFGEYIPLRAQLAPLVSRLDQIARDMVPGEDAGVLEMGSVSVGTMMCFDVAYDDTIADNVRAGAEVLVVQTNNATYYGSDQPEQQWGIERVRAVETGRDVAVASVNGISGFVSADGTVQQRTFSRDRQVLTSR
jgi:apolipoprotein N-acyltransferase